MSLLQRPERVGVLVMLLAGGNGREVNKSTIYKVWAQIKDPTLDGKYSGIGNTGKI